MDRPAPTIAPKPWSAGTAATSALRRAELVSRRYQHKSTVVTTNRAFAEWGEVFPNAACVVSLVDRLMHRAEVVRIDGASYRAKEADERNALRKAERVANAPASRWRKAAR